MSKDTKEQQGGVQGKVVTKKEKWQCRKRVISKCTSQQSNNRAHHNERDTCERSYDTYDIPKDEQCKELQQDEVERSVVMQRHNDVGCQ